MKAPFFVLSALALALSACSSASAVMDKSKVLALPNLALTDPYPISIIDQSTISTSQTPSIAAVGWKTFYSDPKLQALIELGLANNKNLEQAMLAIQKAKARYQISETQSVPTLGVQGGYTRQGSTNDSSGQYTVGLGLSSYELDMWGKIASMKDAALQSYLATSAAKDTAQISLIANIAQSYLAISYAKADLILAQNTVQSRERSLYITQKRFQAGIDSKSPSLQAEASLENAKLAVLNAHTNLLKAQNALQLLIGSPIPDELSPEPAITNIISAAVLNTGLPSELLFYRPDVAGAEYQLKAAGANIHVARAAYFPSISLSGNLGSASDDLGGLFKAGNLRWSFGPNISLPIFDAGAKAANLEVAKIEQQQALANYEATIQTAFREVNDVLATRATLDEQLAAQYRLQSNYQKTYDIAYATFRTGLSNYLDVLDAERSLFAIQQSILQMERQKVISQIELYQVLGGGASLDSQKITDSKTQAQAMMSARLATPDEVKALSKERVPAVLSIVPDKAPNPTLSAPTDRKSVV